MARLKQYERLSLGDPRLERAQEHLEEASREVFANPILDGRLVEGVSVSTTEKQVPHKLGRKYRGFWLAGTKENGAHVELIEGTSANRAKFVAITSNVTATINIYVY